MRTQVVYKNSSLAYSRHCAMKLVDLSQRHSKTSGFGNDRVASQCRFRWRDHAQALGHPSTRAQRQSGVLPLMLSSDDQSSSSKSFWEGRTCRRGWLQAGASISCAAVLAVNAAPLLVQAGGDGGSGDATNGGGGGGGDGDGSGARNHIYDLAEDDGQGWAIRPHLATADVSQNISVPRL